MDGERLREFWNQEVGALLAVYRQFETLLPHPTTAGAEHRGEDGRYVEALLKLPSKVPTKGFRGSHWLRSPTRSENRAK